MIIRLCYLFALLCVGFSCTKEPIKEASCDQIVIIDSELYQDAPCDLLEINSVSIEGNCLVIRFFSSGCSGETWEIKLIDADVILESYPPQRKVRLSLKNEELCDAYFSREIGFNIQSLQVGGNQVLLNITNSGDQILYSY